MAARMKTSVKIAILGGGGRYWAPVVLRDLALCPDLTGEVRLHDLGIEGVRASARTGRALFRHPDSRTTFRIRTTTDLKPALAGADFVVIGISPGPASMFANDLEIPLRHGILHTVGDTTGPAGISRALRAIPIFTAYAEAIAEHCPRAWVVNYANPMTLCTAALYAAFPGIRAFGCCHEVAAAKDRLAKLVAADTGAKRPPREAIHLDVAGVNHFTFALGARHAGRDLMPLVDREVQKPDAFGDATDYARDNAARGAFWDHRGLVGLDLYRRFGALGAAGDRHLVEFVPWYLAGGEASLHRWGVVVTPASFRAGTWTPAPGVTPAPNPLDPGTGLPKRLRPSGEEGVAQICALAGIRDLVTNVNLPNWGQMPQLPAGAVVETNAAFRADRVDPSVAPALPPALAALVRRVTEVQALTLQAGRERDFGLALQAVLLDPLCVFAPDRAETMLREMLTANRALLPGWNL